MTKPQEDGFFKFHWRFMRSGLGKEVGATAGWVLCALASRADQHGICHPSNETISKDTGLSVSAIISSKKILKGLSLIDYWSRRGEDGKTTSQGYKVYPIAAPKSQVKDPLSATGDIKVILDYLSKLELTYSNEAIYLRSHPKSLGLVKIPEETLLAAKKGKIGDLGVIRLYVALSTFHTLREVGRNIKKKFYAKLQGNVDRLAQFTDSMVQAAETLSCPYEDAILKFMEWTKDKKRNKTLNFGIIPLLGNEWLEGLT